MSFYNANNQSPRGFAGGRNQMSQSITSNVSVKNGQLVPKANKQKNECIRVCIRVRPLLQHEQYKDEIVFYPDSKDPTLQGIRIADGQHLIES